MSKGSEVESGCILLGELKQRVKGGLAKGGEGNLGGGNQGPVFHFMEFKFNPKVLRNYCRAFNRKMTGSNTYPKKFILAAVWRLD